MNIFSYIERNVQPKSTSKLYNDAIPSFLHGKSKLFVDHCMARMSDTTLYNMEEVMKISTTRYSITSQSDRNCTYHVNLNTPSCDCPDFQLHYMPCKHFIAVIMLYDAWKDVSIKYALSKYYTINEDFLKWVNVAVTDDVSQKSESSVPLSQSSSLNHEEKDPMNSTPPNKPKFTTDLAKANVAINKIRNYVHNACTNDAIKDATRMLQQCYETVVEHHGDVSVFKKPVHVKHRQLKVPKTFLPKKKLTKRLQKQTKYFKGKYYYAGNLLSMHVILTV